MNVSKLIIYFCLVFSSFLANSQTITNGSFETGTISGSGTSRLSAGSSALTGWTIESSNVDYNNQLIMTAADGSRAINLNGSRAGRISQSITTIVGTEYVVTFSMAGLPASNSNKILTVDISGVSGSAQVYNFDSSGSTASDMGWETNTYTFVAKSTTSVLRFASNISGSNGPYLDNVSITNVTTCNLEDFGSNLANWNVAGIGYTPTIVSGNRLRLTDNNGNRSTFAQYKRVYPGSGNKFSIEFTYYVYGGSGADGITVVLSDSSIAPTPGGYGGSLGYAQNNTPTNGFAGGWLGIGIDEYGNYPNSSENRIGYPSGYTAPTGANTPAGAYANNVSIRGSGVGQSGYNLLANTGTLNPVIWNSSKTSSSVQKFRISFDHTNNTNAYLMIERDTTGTGNSYTTIVPKFDVLANNSGQSAVPSNFVLSLTGSTGGSTNYHEIGIFQSCAITSYPQVPSVNAANFSCLEVGTNNPWVTTNRKPLYTKLVSTPFNLDIAALNSDGTLDANFIGTGQSSKNVTVELFDASTPKTCSAYTSPILTKTVVFSDGVQSTSQGRTLASNILIANAYSNLVCRVTDNNPTTPVVGCSTDTFSVRPQSISSVTSSAASDTNGTNNTATPVVKAGANFTITANTGVVGYNGTPKINTSMVEWLNAPSTGIPQAPDTRKGAGVVGGNFTTAATITTGNSASGTFTYNEAGYFRFQTQGIYDDTFTNSLSSDGTNGDCIVGSYSNTLVGGKYGCNFGTTTNSNHIGRFVPNAFKLSSSVLTNRTDLTCSPSSNFTYLDESFNVDTVVTPINTSGSVTLNYNRARFIDTTLSNWKFGLNNGLTSRLNQLSYAKSWNSSGSLVADYRFEIDRATNPDGPFNGTIISINPTDLDAVSVLTSDLNVDQNTDSVLDAQSIGVTNFYFGRLKVNNVFGSDITAGVVPIEVQYYNNSGFTTNTSDSCTTLTAARWSLNGFQNNIANNELNLVYPTILTNGKAVINYAKPSGGDGKYDGAFNVNYDLVTDNKSYLTGKWTGNVWTENPKGKVSLAKKASRAGMIYILEN